MKCEFVEVIKTDKIQVLTDNFCDAVGIASAIIDLNGTVLIGSRWQRICTDFHRVNLQTCSICIESDTILANRLIKGQKYAIYECRNGLIDAAAPIMIEGEHVANLFVGQFLFQPPDVEYFRKRAREYGFDENAYVEALSEVPIISKERVEPILDFLSGFAELLGEMGLRQVKQLEATDSLWESEARLRAVFDGVAYPMHVVNRDFEVVMTNKRLLDLRNMTQEEAVGRYCYEVYQGREEICEVCAAREVFRTGAPIKVDKTLPLQDGSVRYLEVCGYPVFDERGEVYQAIESTTDITERRQAEDALRRSEARLREVIDLVPHMIFAKDLDGRFILANESTADSHGMIPEKMIGKTYPELVNAMPHEYERFLNDDREVVDSGKPRFIPEEHITYPDGRTVVLQTTKIPFTSAGIPAVLGVAVDITERKKAEDALQKAHDELEIRVRERTADLQAMNKELEAFAYSVSHDLRAPLRAIDGFSQILLEDYLDALDEQGKHYLQRVRAGTQNMGRLIDDLLNLSRIGRQPMTKKTINLEAIAGDAYKSMEDECKGRKVNLTLHQCPPVLADPDLMQIVFVNLSSNALKFTGCRETAEIEVGSDTKDDQTVFFVKDNGVGFDMKYADKVFTPFQRLHRVEEYEGTGVGLSIVQRIIHRHGGRIWVESEVDVGTTFYFTL